MRVTRRRVLWVVLVAALLGCTVRLMGRQDVFVRMGCDPPPPKESDAR